MKPAAEFAIENAPLPHARAAECRRDRGCIFSRREFSVMSWPSDESVEAKGDSGSCGTVKANQYRPYSASNLAERGGNS